MTITPTGMRTALTSQGSLTPNRYIYYCFAERTNTTLSQISANPHAHTCPGPTKTDPTDPLAQACLNIPKLT